MPLNHHQKIVNQWVVLRLNRSVERDLVILMCSSEAEARGIAKAYNEREQGELYWAEYRDSGGTPRSGLNEAQLGELFYTESEDDGCDASVRRMRTGVRGRQVGYTLLPTLSRLPEGTAGRSNRRKAVPRRGYTRSRREGDEGE